MKKPGLFIILAVVLSVLPVCGHMSAGAADAVQQAADTEMYRVSRIMGKEVRSETGESLGLIDNLIIGTDGRIDYIILSTSGPNATGEKLIPLPWEVVATPAREGVFIAGINNRILRDAPGFDRSHWPDLTSSEWERSIYSYYGMPGGAEYRQIAQINGRSTPSSGQRRDSVAAPETVVVPVHRLADYLGQDVLSRQGERLGEVDDFVFDSSLNRVSYAILDIGGSLGKGDKEVAVPWRAITINDGKLRLQNTDREKLTSAPSFSRGERPDFTDREWENKIHSYFGEKPYWLDENPSENKG